jgi:hypothetical protein
MYSCQMKGYVAIQVHVTITFYPSFMRVNVLQDNTILVIAVV